MLALAPSLSSLPPNHDRARIVSGAGTRSGQWKKLNETLARSDRAGHRKTNSYT
jgi:hypothetical protein